VPQSHDERVLFRWAAQQQQWQQPAELLMARASGKEGTRRLHTGKRSGGTVQQQTGGTRRCGWQQLCRAGIASVSLNCQL